MISLGLILIFLAGVFLIWYYFNLQNNECQKSPLVYGARQLEEQYGVKTSGSISFIGYSGWISFNGEELIQSSQNDFNLNLSIYSIKQQEVKQK